mgnify:CR=1 FL=1
MFFKIKRNYIILTNSGKPVFSYQGDMYLLSSIYATLYAIISKVQTYDLQPISLATAQGAGPEIDVIEQELAYENEDNIMATADGGKKKGILRKIGGLLKKKVEEEIELLGSDDEGKRT